MADYGLSVINNHGAIMINDQHKVMVFAERGSFRIQSRYTDREGSGSVIFGRAIHTDEPPQVFLRHVNGVHASLGVYITLQGGPGNWTGFTITSAVRHGSDLQNYLMDYVACKFADTPSAQRYGLNLFDAQGRPLFSSQDRVVRYGKFTKHWTKTADTQVDHYHSGLAIEADDFICISAIDRGVSWFASGADYVGLVLLRDNRRVLEISAQRTGGGYWYYQDTNGTCFGIPVCKFPEHRYHN